MMKPVVMAPPRVCRGPRDLRLLRCWDGYRLSGEQAEMILEAS